MKMLDKQIVTAQESLSKLRARAGETPEVLDDAIVDLSAILEELVTGAEELREENDELLAARELVEEGRKRYQELFDRAPDGYVVTDPKGNLLELNHAAALMFGRTPELLRSSRWRLSSSAKTEGVFETPSRRSSEATRHARSRSGCGAARMSSSTLSCTSIAPSTAKAPSSPFDGS